jgi:hypothetical protein
MEIKVKVEFTPELAMKARSGESGIAQLLL